MSYFTEHHRLAIEEDVGNVAAGLAERVARSVTEGLDARYDFRYLLLDGESGQLETRTLFESSEEARRHAESLGIDSYLIGTLLVENIEQ